LEWPAVRRATFDKGTGASIDIDHHRRTLYATDSQPDRGNFGAIARDVRNAGGCFLDAPDEENPA
jgi:hypothetical protein